MSSVWDQLQQLLTCPICLDKYRMPKLLPCHHSFCQEPCMEGLQDYARRQIKCPVCRAGHRIPLQGIQSYPTNVTLMQFLELHQSISGEEPEPIPSMMERCGICSERSLVQKCYHCDKKICSECKEAHLDILKREISRICSQVRRALNRLQESLTQTEKNSERLNINYGQIKNEIEEVVRRFIKDLKAREEKLIHELEQYTQNEIKNLEKLKEDLEIEHQNMGDNCDLIEKIVSDAEKNWTDVELIEYKDIFLKTLEFLRSFDPDSSDYARRVKFVPSTDLNELRRNVANFGELKLPQPEIDLHLQKITSSLNSSGSANLLTAPQNVLMRSQSDHRLAAQFARRESRFGDLISSTTRLNSGGYSDSERDPRSERSLSPISYSRTRRDSELRLGRYGMDRNEDKDISRNRYLQDSSSYRSNWTRLGQDDEIYRASQFKSRFMREREADLSLEDHDYESGSGLHRSVRFEEPQVQAQPLKVFDTQDAPRGPLSGIVKLSDCPHVMERMHENEARAKAEKERKEEESFQPSPAPQTTYQTPRRPPSRQVSEDEIEKQKKMNKMTASSTATNNTNNKTALLPPATNPVSAVLNKTAPTNAVSESLNFRQLSRRASNLKDEETRADNVSRTSLDATSQVVMKREIESNSLEDNEDSNDTSDLGTTRLTRRRRTSVTTTNTSNTSNTSNEENKDDINNTKPQVSAIKSKRLMSSKSSPLVGEDINLDSNQKNSRRRNLGETNTLSQDDSEEEENNIAQPVFKSKYAEANYGKHGRYRYRTRDRDRDKDKSLLNEEANGSSAWAQYLRTKYGSSQTSSFGSFESGLKSTLTKSKSSNAVCTTTITDSSDEENNINYSRTSRETDIEKKSQSGYSLPRNIYLQKKKLAFKIGVRGTEQGCFTWPRGIAISPDNNIVVADSSNHRVQVFDATGRFVFEFGTYGSNEGEFDCLAGVAVNRIGQFIVSDRYNHRIQVFDPSGRFLRSFGCEGRADGRFSYPWGITTDSLGFIYVCDKENHRIQVFQSDGSFVGKFGSIGSRPGHLEHPHYIAISNTNRVIVSDTNNHRIQIFDVNGRSITTFGIEGTDEGQFKFPRGIAVDDQGYIIVGDSGNNRIQIFNPDGSFLKSFGSWGSGDGEFKGLEGVAISTTGNIFVCDRENHRIQAF